MLYHDCIRLVKTTCNRPDNSIKLVTTCCKLVTTNQEQAKTTCEQLVNRLLKTCVFLRVYLSHPQKTRNNMSCTSMQYVSLIQASAPIKIHAHIPDIRPEKEQSWQKILEF